MLTRERSGAPPFLKLSAIGLTSYRCIIIGWNGYTSSVSCPFRFLYRLYRPSSPYRSGPSPDWLKMKY